MSSQKIDRDGLKAFARSIASDDRLELLDRCLDRLSVRHLSEVFDGHTSEELYRMFRKTAESLLLEVEIFRDASLRGDYYESFRVNSRNFKHQSSGTRTWIAECERWFKRSVAAAREGAHVEVCASFEILFGLLRHLDEGHDDIVFFADEGGSYEVSVDWETVIPAYAVCTAATASPEETAEKVASVVKTFADYTASAFARRCCRGSARPTARPSSGACHRVGDGGLQKSADRKECH